MKKRLKKIIIREEDSDSNWLISYADLMTLLMGFFLILSAMSTPDFEKVERMKKGAAEAMGTKYTVPHKDLKDVIENVLKDNKLDEEFSVESTLVGVKITSKSTFFFESGSAELSGGSDKLMDQLAKSIKVYIGEYKIVVEGHTDNVPINTEVFPSNWELSAARASAVIRSFEGHGMDRKNLMPIGLADTHPLKPNMGDDNLPILENQARNRRTVIFIRK